MSTDHSTELPGPDFSAGIVERDLADGAMLLGHAGGEAVLLSRVGSAVCAVSAKCTHYGGPLAEGLRVGDTVRCPWHHACFSLRNGEALRAPALNPLASWRVEQRDGRLVVTEKREAGPLAATYPIAKRASQPPERILIVGAGAAGSAAAEMLRRCDYRGRITVVDDDADAPYDRPNLSKDYLAGNAPEDWIPIRPAGFYAEHDIEVVRGRASRLDLSARSVTLADEKRLEYDACLLATGADPVRLDIPGAQRPHVHVLRTLRDSRAIIERAQAAQRAVVLGASYIGLEVAASLRSRGVAVHVVAPEELPLARVMGRDLGAFIKELHEQRGVTFHLGTRATSIDEDDVTLEDGDRLGADLVVIGVGVRPRVTLASVAGLAEDHGVTVDEFLRTSDAHVWAAGDIARWPDARTGSPIRVEHWVVAQRMGQTAARNMLGADEPFDDVPFFWSAHYDVSINYVGHAEQWDRVAVDGDARRHDIAVRFLSGERSLAVATIYRDRESLESELGMERESPRS